MLLHRMSTCTVVTGVTSKGITRVNIRAIIMAIAMGTTADTRMGPGEVTVLVGVGECLTTVVRPELPSPYQAAASSSPRRCATTCWGVIWAHFLLSIPRIWRARSNA
jgi:hypothetical protein